MIKFLPEATRTLVVPHEWDDVLDRLSAATQTDKSNHSLLKLTGWISDDRFQLMVRQRRPNGFMPLVEGRIDPTSGGCLIFLRYRLVPSTRMYLVVWTLITLLSGIFLSTQQNSILISLISIVVIGLIYAVAWANFRIHQKPLHDIIIRLLE